MSGAVTPSGAVTDSATRLSLREAGRALGVSAPSVMRAIRSGRLHSSVVVGADGKPKIVDIELARREWAANTDLSKAPGYVKERAEKTPRRTPPAPPEPAAPGHPDETSDPADQAVVVSRLSEASALEKEWRAKLAEQAFKVKSGELVNAQAIEAKLVEVFTRCKTKLLGLPSKAKAALPALTHADVLILDRIVREALEELTTDAGSQDDGDAAA